MIYMSILKHGVPMPYRADARAKKNRNRMSFAKMKMPVWDRYLVAAAFMLGLTTAAPMAQTSDLVSKTALRVCADPANFPMSSKDGSGYENKLAELVAAKLELPVQYTWYPMATGFIRNTLKAKKCDVVMAYAQGHELVLNTNHYLTSVYTLIVPTDGDLAAVRALDDPALEGRRIGIIAGTPPAAHMARNGLIGQAQSYNLFVDRRHESPGTDMRQLLSVQEASIALGLDPDTPLLGYYFKGSYLAQHPGLAQSFYDASRDAKQYLATSDDAWEAIRPRMVGP